MGNRLFRYIPVAVLVLFGLPHSTGADDQTSHDNPPQEFSARVVQVEAGDIITILWDGQREKLRLSDIATPKPGQPFQAEAQAFTSRLAGGKKVNVMLFRHDQLGLAVGRVALPDGRILNHEIIRAGLAWFSRKFSEDEETARLEAEARAARRGLWARSDPVPPWEYEAPESGD